MNLYTSNDVKELLPHHKICSPNAASLGPVRGISSLAGGRGVIGLFYGHPPINLENVYANCHSFGRPSIRPGPLSESDTEFSSFCPLSFPERQAGSP